VSVPDGLCTEARAIEAVLIGALDPVPPGILAELLELPVERVEELCAAIARSYEEGGHGIAVARVAGGYRFQSHPDCHQYVERFLAEGAGRRLSPAALETLAIVAYKQPISRAQVSVVRGVNVEGVMRLLTQRGLIAQVARDEGPGQAVLFGTTALFLEQLGIDSLADLPALERFVPDVETVELLEQALRAGPAG
jgi:segregation and condensation protein B